MENPQPNVSTKKSSPNRPYTIDGIPDRVSVVSLISPNSLLPLLAYSTRNIAANIPSGTAITSEIRVIISVFIRAGINDAFSDVCLNSKIEEFI